MYLFLVKFLFRVLFCSRIAKRNDTKRKNIIGQVSIFTHYLHTVFIRIGSLSIQHPIPDFQQPTKYSVLLQNNLNTNMTSVLNLHRQ